LPDLLYRGSKMSVSPPLGNFGPPTLFLHFLNDGLERVRSCVPPYGRSHDIWVLFWFYFSLSQVLGPGFEAGPGLLRAGPWYFEESRSMVPLPCFFSAETFLFTHARAPLSLQSSFPFRGNAIPFFFWYTDRFLFRTRVIYD